MPTTLSLYTIRLPPSNHSSCSDVPSKSHPIILHTTKITPYQYNHATSSDVTTPQTTSWSHRIITPPSCHILRISQHLRPPVTQLVPHHPPNSTRIPKYLYTFFNPSQYPPLMFQVLREQFPTVLASGGIVDEIPPLPVSHPQTSQGANSRNHTRSTISDTVTDSDTSYHP